MDTRHRNGAAAELFVASVLAEQGYNILYPLITQSRYDIVTEDPFTGEFRRVQIKKASWSKSGKYEYLQVRIAGKNKLTNTPYKESDIDDFMFTDMKRIWSAPSSVICGLTSVCLDSSNELYKPQTKYDSKQWRIH